MVQPLWSPQPDDVEQSHLTRFILWLAEHRGLSISDPKALHTWSITHRAAFWEALWHFLEVRYHSGYHTVLSEGDHMLQAQWFQGAALNFAENLLSRQDDSLAMVFVDEGQHRHTWTYHRLYQTVARWCAGLQRCDLQPGDRVVGLMPNRPETVVAMLATTAMGAVWSACSPDFGAQAVIDRFKQIQPKVLVTTDGQYHKGRFISNAATIQALLKQLPSLQQLVVVPYHEQFDTDWPQCLGTPIQDFQGDRDVINFVATGFMDPIYILYSSGTTGSPKCMVHGAGGTLLQHLKELVLHQDLKSQEKIFFYTTCGWMMWHWLVSSLAQGACVVLFDGCPTYPHEDVLWSLIEQEGLHHFGTSAGFLSRCQQMARSPKTHFDFKTLRSIMSTGSPLSPETFQYCYEHVKADMRLSSMSGGSDIISCFALGHPHLPVYAGQLQSLGLGMAVDVFDQQGHSTTEQGELVCTQAFPSMPVHFWDDPDKTSYHRAYFECFPGVWHHGDYAQMTPQAGLVIAGRSDNTLNPNGVRIGTGEIYRCLHRQEIVESVVIEQIQPSGSRMILFVQLQPDLQLTDALIRTIKQDIRRQASPRHVPDLILQVQGVPKTINGKVAESAVRAAVHGQSLHQYTTLVNADCLPEYQDHPAL